MKYLIITRRRTNPLPIETMEPARKWISDRIADGRLECCYSLLEGGGISIANATSHEALMKMLKEYPEARYVDFEIHGLCDINAVFEEAESRATVTARAAAS